MNGDGAASERVLVLAPRGRDGPLAAKLLGEAGFQAHLCGDIAAVGKELIRGAAVAILADEALAGVDINPFATLLRRQPSWSDFPIILLTRRGDGQERDPVAARLAKDLGNVTFLERPFHPTTLVSAARAAVRGRRRQYDARARLEELSEAGKQLQTALQAGRLGAWTLRAEPMAFEGSQACLSHFGRPSGALFSYDQFCEAVHPADIVDMRHAMAHSLSTGEDYAIEHRVIWPDRSVHWIDMRARAVKNPLGAVERLVGVSSDITARKTSEIERERLLRELANEREALSNLTETLENRVRERTAALEAEVSAREKAQQQLFQAQKVESLGKLTGGIAHDFNNLLMAVIGSLDLLRKQLPDNPRAQRLIGAAMQGAERGAALTKRMLAFARQQDLNTTSVDIAALLDGMGDLFQRSLGPRIALRLEVAKGLPPAKVDANQVELAILNLAINARDAMPDGGLIEVTADLVQVEEKKTLEAGPYIRVQVRDTGAGMDAALLERAREPFFSTKAVGKGTGLGLSMVDGLAVQLGGLFELASEIGKGTVATLWLPVATQAAAAVETLAPQAPASRAATIMVVDDDPLIAMNTVDMLEDLGHTVIEANSGKQALEILHAGQPLDLLMTDHAMPGMTGTELARIIRRERPGLPVLLATGYADLGADQNPDLPRLAKPYHQAQLQMEIDRLLCGHA